MYRRKFHFLISIVSAFLLLLASTQARAAYFADYFPLTLGSWWQGVILVPVEIQGETIFQQARTEEVRVFESMVYDGHDAVKYGEPYDYTIASKSGNLVTIHAFFEEGEEYDHEDFTVGEIRDGEFIQAQYETLLIREFSKIPASLWPEIELGQYEGLVEGYLATRGLILTVDFSGWSQPNLLNDIVLFGLGSDIKSRISTGVSSITFWAPGIGQVLEIDMQSGTGQVEDISVLTDYYIAPETKPALIEGIVTDAVTGLPLADAQLSLTPSSQILTTNNIGRFSSSFIPPGTYNVQVSASNYYTKTLTGISLLAGSPNILNVSLEQKAPLVTGSRLDAPNDGHTAVLLTAQVSHPEGAEFLAGVTADLTAVGGSPSQPLRDDGTAGDAVSADGLYSYGTTIPSSIPARLYNLTVKAADETGFSGFGAILLNVLETVTGIVASNQSDKKTFSNVFAGQTLLISYTVNPLVLTASSKRITNDCSVTLTVTGPNGESAGPYEVEDSIDISIPGASVGTWTYETVSNCPSTVSYQIQTKGSGTGLLTGRVLDGLSGKGLQGAQVRCDTGGSTQSLDEGYYTMVAVSGTGATVSTSKSGYQTNFKTGVVITTGDTTPLNIQVVPETSAAQPVPQGQHAYQVLDPSEDPGPPTQPFAAAVSGSDLRFKALFPSYQQPVDFYLGMTVDYPGLSGRLFLINTEDAIVELTDVLHPWRKGVTAAQTGDFSIPSFTSGFPMAPYTLYALVTPDSSTLNAFELSYLGVTLAQAPPNSQNVTYVANPSDEPDPVTQPLAAKVSAGNLLLKAHFAMQVQPVTIFLACLTPGGELYLIRGGNTLDKYSGTLWPWRQDVQTEQREEVISLPLSAIGGGNAFFYSMVTTDPIGFSKYNLIYFQKALD